MKQQHQQNQYNQHNPQNESILAPVQRRRNNNKNNNNNNTINNNDTDDCSTNNNNNNNNNNTGGDDGSGDTQNNNNNTNWYYYYYNLMLTSFQPTIMLFLSKRPKWVYGLIVYSISVTLLLLLLVVTQNSNGSFRFLLLGGGGGSSTEQMIRNNNSINNNNNNNIELNNINNNDNNNKNNNNNSKIKTRTAEGLSTETVSMQTMSSSSILEPSLSSSSSNNQKSIDYDRRCEYDLESSSQQQQQRWPATGIGSIYIEQKIRPESDDEDENDDENDDNVHDTNNWNNSIHNYNNNNNNNNDMVAIVHIGPHKTGSTTIQYIAHKYIDTLFLDKYEMPNTLSPGLKDKPNHGYLAQCLKKYDTQIEYNFSVKHHCDTHLFLQIIRIATRNHNILLSAERFASYAVQPKIIRTMLSPYPITNIRIVAYYRRFYEWILSWNNELNKRKSVPERESIIDWITNTGRIRSILNSNYVSASATRFRTYFPNVIVYNMHDPNYMLSTSFFCDAIPNAIHTCSAIRIDVDSANATATNTNSNNNDDDEDMDMDVEVEVEEDNSLGGNNNNVYHQNGTTSSSNSNNSSNTATATSTTTTTTTTATTNTASLKINAAVPFVYDELAHEAIQMKFIKIPYVQKRLIMNNKKYGGPVRHYAQLARNYQETILQLTEYDFDIQYRVCPPEHYIEKILQISLQEEQFMFPLFYNTIHGENNLRTHFDSIKYHKFCIINATSILENDYNGWKTFFTSL